MEGNWTMKKFKPGSSDSKIALTVLCNSFVLVFFEIVGGVWVAGCSLGYAWPKP